MIVRIVNPPLKGCTLSKLGTFAGPPKPPWSAGSRQPGPQLIWSATPALRRPQGRTLAGNPAQPPRTSTQHIR